MLSHFATPWTVACQAPLTMRFSRQEYWSGLPCPAPGDLSHSGTEPESHMSPELAGEFFTTSSTWVLVLSSNGERLLKCTRIILGMMKMSCNWIVVMGWLPRGTVVKNLPVNAEDARDGGPIPGWGRSPDVGNGNPLQYSCLEHSMDRGAWWATVHEVAKSATRLSGWVLAVATAGTTL